MVLTVLLFLALLSVGEGTSEWQKGRDVRAWPVHGGVIRSYSSLTVVIQVSRLVHASCVARGPARTDMYIECMHVQCK